MSSKAVDKNRDDAVPTEKKLDDLYDLIKGFDTCMLTTRRADGRLVSRAMAVQERKEGTADLWFMTTTETHKVEELEQEPQVNVAFYDKKSREWVSVAGRATLSRDRATIKRLYAPDWKAWMGDEGGERDGGPGDPRIMLILVEAESVEYLKKNKPQPVVLFEIAKGILTGEPPKLGAQRSVAERELKHAPTREAR